MSAPNSNGDGDAEQTVYSLIHELHNTITKSIDTSLSWETLNGPPVNFSIVRPIVERLCPKVAEEKVRSGDRLVVPVLGEDGGEAGVENGSGEEQGEGLGIILFALMANRYVPLLPSSFRFPHTCSACHLKDRRRMGYKEDW
jgi:hypothetical protein